MPSDPRREPLDVAVAVIQENGRYLIAQRLREDSFGGRWEFPGGKAHPGESLKDCLAREIQEELGILIEVGATLAVIEHRYPGTELGNAKKPRTIRLHCFACRILKGQPQAIQCAAWRWVNPKELKSFEFPPASGPLIQLLSRQP